MLSRPRYENLGQVDMPAFTGVRVLMMPFLLEDVAGSLPEFLANWIPTIDQITQLGECGNGTAYLTIDECKLFANTTHRRPGLHVQS